MKKLIVLVGVLLLFVTVVRAQVITYNTGTKGISYIYRYNSTGGTYSANLAGTSPRDIFDDTAVAGDMIYFGSADNTAFSDINITIGTPLVASAINITWEYYSYSPSGWYPLQAFQDDTNMFQNVGNYRVRFGAQINSTQTTVNGLNKFWVRARIVNVTNLTEGGQWINTSPIAYNGLVNIINYTEGSPCTMTAVSNYLETNFPYLGTIRQGRHFDLRRVGLNITSRLKSVEESIEIGNTDSGEGHFKFQNWGYLQLGEKSGTNSGRRGSSIFAHFGTYSFLFETTANTRIYGSSVITPGGAGGYPSIRGEIIDSRLDLIPQFNNSNVSNSQIRVGGVGVILFQPNIFFNNKVIIANMGIYGYQSDIVTNLLDYEFESGVALIYLYQTYSHTTNIFYNPKKPLPSQNDTYKTMSRAQSAQGDIYALVHYDATTTNYTNKTVEARDSTVNDVPLTGTTPAVNDAIYIKTYPTIVHEAFQQKLFYVTMGNVTNTDNTYVWEMYTSAGWKDALVWDQTEGFKKSGYVAISSRNNANQTPAVTTIGRETGTWVRARITNAGTSKPVVTNITGAQGNGISNWTTYEKYSIDLKIVDENGNAINGSNVTVYDSNGVQQFSVLTNESGQTSSQYLTARKFFFDPVKYPSNYLFIGEEREGLYTINITKVNYTDVNFKFNLTTKIDWTLTQETRQWNYSQPLVWKILNSTNTTILKLSEDGNLAIAGKLYEYTNSPPANVVYRLANKLWLTIKGDLYLAKELIQQAT